jgi:hypothetical protein
VPNKLRGDEVDALIARLSYVNDKWNENHQQQSQSPRRCLTRSEMGEWSQRYYYSDVDQQKEVTRKLVLKWIPEAERKFTPASELDTLVNRLAIPKTPPCLPPELPRVPRRAEVELNATSARLYTSPIRATLRHPLSVAAAAELKASTSSPSKRNCHSIQHFRPVSAPTSTYEIISSSTTAR